MKLSRRVRIGSGESGEYLDEIHEAVVVQGFDPGTPQETLSTATRMGGFGQRITGQHWDTLESSVSFGINVPKKNLKLRAQIFNAVRKWALKAEGSYIYATQMPGKRLYVDRVTVPSAGDLFEWTNSYEIIFRAYSIPFWQDSSQTAVTVKTITRGSAKIEIPGDVQTIIGLTFKNKSGKVINNFSADVNGLTMSFENLGLPGSGELEIKHTATGRLRILMNGKSVLGKRVGADDFYVNPGWATVTIDSERAGSLEIRTVGRYL